MIIKLTKNFFQTRKDPCEVNHFISREQWEISKRRREYEEFKVKKVKNIMTLLLLRLFYISRLFCRFCKQAISDKAKRSSKHNERVHFVGHSGYHGKRTKWCVDDPLSCLENLESLDPSILSNDHIGRSYNRGGCYFIPNSQTKEVFKKMASYLILRFRQISYSLGIKTRVNCCTSTSINQDNNCYIEINEVI